MNKINECVDYRDHAGNAFDFLRLIAACTVLLSHSYLIFGLDEPKPMGTYTLGAIAVFVFFSLSGFLVCQSWVRDPDFFRFSIRRGLRIFPGLAVMLIFTVLILGPLVSNSALSIYLSDSSVWTYFFKNLLTVAGDDRLPDVFENNSVQGVINGSLWTLRYEILMYIILALVGCVSSGLAFKRLCLLVAILFVSLYIYLSSQGLDHWTLPIPLVWKIGLFFDVVEVSKLGVFFFSGCCLFLYREEIRFSWIVSLVLCLCAFIVKGPLLETCVLWLIVPYVTLFAAHSLPRFFRRIGKYGDISYGVYIYAYPIQQMVAFYFIPDGYSWFDTFVTSSILTLVFAAISWVLVERPAIAIKTRFHLKQAVV